MTNMLQKDKTTSSTDTDDMQIECAESLTLGPIANRLLTPREVAIRLGVSERWVRDHATRRHPRIAVVKLGPLLRFRPEDVAQFIAEQRVDSFAIRRRNQ